jgi:hypothetical protein
MITDDCIGNYMFLADHNPCDLNTALSSSSEHFSEEEVVVIDDHKLISREQESHQSSSREAVMVEQVFFLDQHVSDLQFQRSSGSLHGIIHFRELESFRFL